MRIAAMLLGLSLICCVSPSEGPLPSAPALDLQAATHHLPEGVKDREGWAEDIIAALRFIKKEPTAERFCAVVAVIAQESNFQKDPVVPDLPRIVRKGLEKKFERLGALSGPVLAALLAGSAPNSGITFNQRIDRLRTEGDLDRMFRDLAAAYREKMPGPYLIASTLSMFMGRGSLQDLNPITTAGSMQVKVSFAKTLKGNTASTNDEIRELLYTRAGGIRVGTARLIDYQAPYDDLVYRFADYNAGYFASRNAAIQAQLNDLTGEHLELDGDLLLYDDEGRAQSIDSKTLTALLTFGSRNDLSARTVRNDAESEKSEDFESTDTYKKIREVWALKMKRPVEYARLPEVAINSPKLAKSRSTSWFAKRVKQRYLTCRSRD